MNFQAVKILAVVLVCGWIGSLRCVHLETQSMNTASENLEHLVSEGIRVGFVSRMLSFVVENPNAVVKVKKEIPEDWSSFVLGYIPFIKENLEAQRRLSNGESRLGDLRIQREKYLSSWYGKLDQLLSHPIETEDELKSGEWGEINLEKDLFIVSFCQFCAMLFIFLKMFKDVIDSNVSFVDDDENKDDDDGNESVDDATVGYSDKNCDEETGQQSMEVVNSIVPNETGKQVTKQKLSKRETRRRKRAMENKCV